MQPFGPQGALIVVDVQNDFADPLGSLSVAGGEALIPGINEAAWTAIRAGAFVAYTQDWHPVHTPHFAQDGGIWPVHCIGGAWGSAFHPDLELVGPSVRKGTAGEDGYSGFTTRDPTTGAEAPTELDALLRVRGIQRVLVCGLATDYCVKSTALDAARLGYATAVLVDSVAAVDLKPGDGVAALAELRAAGVELARWSEVR
jgi:nicotinamidase/pyrazinamidase